MKKSMVWGLVILLGAAAGAFGQAALPAFYSGPWKVGPLPSGWSQNGLDTDYGTSYDPAGGTPAKLNSAGDLVQINFNSAPSKVSYWVKKNGTSADPYSFNMQESVAGSTWTDVAIFANTGTVLPTTETVYTNNLSSASRYVRFIYITKANGINVGLDGVSIAGPGIPSITFNPSGTTNAPVSNTFTMAVSVTPSGSGIQSWSMAPTNVGPASLTNGTFSFTPAASDNSKTFTVSVIATNSIGTTTGTATIAVTAYAPPVPVITFSPVAPYSIMATQTQKLGIAIAPAGSGIQSWTLFPSNYAGSASVVGTNFTFSTAAADGPSNYTLSVIATNSFGTSTGTAVIAVSEYIPPPPPGAYFIDFESTSKPNYPATNVTINGKSWELAEALIGNLAGDQRFDGYSFRMRYSDTLPCAMTSQSKLITNGVGTISLWYAAYGGAGSSEVTLAIEISDSLTSNWVELDSFGTMGVTNLSYRSVDVYVNTPVYVRIRAKSGLAENRASVDNITITDYASPAATPYDAFLLQYNVTPGDPGTATNENLDGDAFTNQQEFNAGTNPYDDAIHP
jgi:hypothetical protein